jgi:hypothetical protein
VPMHLLRIRRVQVRLVRARPVVRRRQQGRPQAQRPLHLVPPRPVRRLRAQA